MSDKKRGSAVLGLVAVVAFLMTGRGNSSSSGKSGHSSIPVGGMILLTGQIALFGQGALQGLKAGVHEVNAAGGVMGHLLNLIVADWA